MASGEIAVLSATLPNLMEVSNCCWMRFCLAFEFVLAIVIWSVHTYRNKHWTHTLTLTDARTTERDIGTARCGVRYGTAELNPAVRAQNTMCLRFSSQRIGFWCGRVTQFEMSSLRLGCLVLPCLVFSTKFSLACSWFNCSHVCVGLCLRSNAAVLQHFGFRIVCADIFFLLLSIQSDLSYLFPFFVCER